MDGDSSQLPIIILLLPCVRMYSPPMFIASIDGYGIYARQMSKRQMLLTNKLSHSRGMSEARLELKLLNEKNQLMVSILDQVFVDHLVKVSGQP